MKNSNSQTIWAIIGIIFVIVFIVFVAREAVDRQANVYCLKLQSQAVEFGRSYSKWAEENSSLHERDVQFCKQYGVEIVLHY